MNTLILSALLVSGGGLIGLLVHLLVILIIFALVWWAISVIPMEPFLGQIVKVVFTVIVVIVLIYFLLSVAGCAQPQKMVQPMRTAQDGKSLRLLQMVDPSQCN